MGEHAEDRQAGRLEATVEFEREKHVGKLRLGVEGETAIGFLPLDILEMDTAAAVQLGADGNDASAGWHGKQRQQAQRQGEMGEVIDAELGLMALPCQSARRHHDTGIVDEEIDRPALGDEPVRKGRNIGEIGKIEPAEHDLGTGKLGAKAAQCPLSPARIPRGHHHVGAPPRKLPHRQETEAAIGAGHDGEAAGLIRHLRKGPWFPPRLDGCHTGCTHYDTSQKSEQCLHCASA